MNRLKIYSYFLILFLSSSVFAQGNILDNRSGFGLSYSGSSSAAGANAVELVGVIGATFYAKQNFSIGGSFSSNRNLEQKSFQIEYLHKRSDWSFYPAFLVSYSMTNHKYYNVTSKGYTFGLFGNYRFFETEVFRSELFGGMNAEFLSDVPDKNYFRTPVVEDQFNKNPLLGLRFGVVFNKFAATVFGSSSLIGDRSSFIVGLGLTLLSVENK